MKNLAAISLLLLGCASDSPYATVGRDAANLLTPDEIWWGHSWGDQDLGPKFNGETDQWMLGATWYVGARDVRVIDTRRKWFEANTEAEVIEDKRRAAFNLGGVEFEAEESNGGAAWMKITGPSAAIVGAFLLSLFGYKQLRKKKKD